MTTFTETARNRDFLISEANDARSRDAITLDQDAAIYEAGTVLMASGANYARHDGAVATTAVAILDSDVDAIAADAPGVAYFRDIEFRTAKLVWAGTVDAGEQTAALANLLTLGMVARDSN